MSKADRGIVSPEYAREYMRGLMHRDVDLSPIIESIRNGTYVPDIPDIDMLSEDQKEGKQIWVALKAERNALTSLALEDIWNSFSHTRQIEVEKAAGERHHAYTLEGITVTHFKRAISGWYRQRLKQAAEQTIESWCFSRMNSIINYGKNIDYLSPDEDLRSYLGRGVNTSSDAVWGLIDIVPRLAQIQHLAITRQQAVRTIEKAYGPVIQLFSSLNQRTAMHFLDPISDGPHGLFDEQFFSLNSDEADFTLSLNYDRLFAIQNMFFGNVTIKHLKPYGATTWCPARYAKGEHKDVVREYFEWSMNIAKKSFTGLLSLPE